MSTPRRSSARSTVIAAALVGVGMGIGAVLSSEPAIAAPGSGPSWDRVVARLAPAMTTETYASDAFIQTLPARGYFTAPEDQYLIVTEFLPETGVQIDNLLIEVHEAFVTRWDNVRNGLVVAPGEIIRNLNDVRVTIYGYHVQPERHRTVADLERSLIQRMEALTVTVADGLNVEPVTVPTPAALRDPAE